MNYVQRARDFLRRRRHAYNLVFRADGGKTVLQDLAKFCRANQTAFDADPRVHAVLEGRREVWLRIQEHLNLSTDELYHIYNPAKPLAITQGQNDET